jgi:biopolymer transport protein ExbD
MAASRVEEMNPLPPMLMRSRLAMVARPRARVEIIPLIDVVFFLLATFVLFTLSLNKITSLPVDLPKVGGHSDIEPVTIQVGEAGAVYWNGDAVAPRELPGLLAHYKAQADDPRIFVTGEAKAKFGAMVAVLDEVRKAGLKTYSVETKPRPAGR